VAHTRLIDFMEDSPQVIIIAGPNGAGKTSSSPFLLRNNPSISAFVNADAIAAGLSAFRPETVAIEAGRIMLRRIKDLSDQRESFAFETTLAARAYAPWLRQLRGTGYEFHLLFLWLRTAEVALGRVAERVRRGGHAIPEQEIRRRYQRGLTNLFDLYLPLADTWAVYDNSNAGATPSLIAAGRQEQPQRIAEPDSWRLLLESRREET
jgi:predicted ABC-type ATPase